MHVKGLNQVSNTNESDHFRAFGECNLIQLDCYLSERVWKVSLQIQLKPKSTEYGTPDYSMSRRESQTFSIKESIYFC